ncbi:MAG: sugar phosphate nucleotidyltransferase [Flavobacteriaceae bacterium]|nr:sugar phosphate nucleotidyltransferase [Flavobacteriaceae bacterium]
MKNNSSIIILAAGMSSRMKKSLGDVSLDPKIQKVAQSDHKSLIPVTQDNDSLMSLLLQNIESANYTDVYLITSSQNQGFKNLVGSKDADNLYGKLKIHFVIQKIAHNRSKPAGTADALLQAYDQYPQLKSCYFTVCNGDNLYSVATLKALKSKRKAPCAMIAYDRDGLQFPQERISKFAIINCDENWFLKKIIEKPSVSQIAKHKDANGSTRLSMNVFNFDGGLMFPFIKECPFNEIRDEKELPQAVVDYVAKNPKGMLCIPVSEHLPDLTSAHDIEVLKGIG